MKKVKGKNTKPEILIRSMLHRMGYRFRLHRKDLPGNPDIVLPKYKKVIFVHGCFWHGHQGCKRASLPATNRQYWVNKIKKNKVRDAENMKKLKESGWTPLILWTCRLKNREKIKKELVDFLENS